MTNVTKSAGARFDPRDVARPAPGQQQPARPGPAEIAATPDSSVLVTVSLGPPAERPPS
ncbi:MAG: hypothetical protein ACRDRJ_10320 [Streptosporangiaceae bacterium]